MNSRRELDIYLADLEQIRACRKVVLRCHDAETWLSAEGTRLADDEIVANIVLGGSVGMPGTMADSLTWAELQCITHQLEQLGRYERALEARIERLRVRIGKDASRAAIARLRKTETLPPR